MIIGDFNTTMSIGMDQLNYDTDPHFKCREYITGLETGEQFHDIFRSIHPGVKAYTWRESDGNKRSRLDIAMASPSLLNHVKEITQKAHHFEATDHSTIKITFDFNNSEGGPGIFRCQSSLHTNPKYKSLIRTSIRLAIYECLLTNNRQSQMEVEIIRHRQKIEAELNDKLAKDDPLKINRINKLQIHLGMILSNEPTLESLIQRPLAVSNATLHEFILMKLKQVTLTFAKTLKNNTKRETAKLEEELNDLVNSNDPNSAEKIRALEEFFMIIDNDNTIISIMLVVIRHAS
jgi:hypothetical protein